MNKFNKFIILAGLLLSFSATAAEIKELESLETISKQILGETTSTKTKKEKAKETVKKEVTKMIENKKEKLKENNIKIDIISDLMNDEENYYILDFESDKGVARLEITTPHFAPYYYACFNILWLNDDEAYCLLDEENSTVTEILKKLEKYLMNLCYLQMMLKF